MPINKSDHLLLGKDLWEALDLWEPEVVSLDFNRRLYKRIADRQARNRRLRLASAAPVLALVALFFLLGRSRSEIKVPVGNTATVQTPPDIEMLRQIDSIKSL